MPKYALISDIHGNLPALTSVLSEIENEGIDDILCLGDIVGYGADPSRAFSLLWIDAPRQLWETTMK